MSYSFTVLSKNHYYEDTRDLAGIISHVINGDTVEGYIRTGKKDEYYYNTEVFLRSFCDEVDLTDISIYVPGGDKGVYVWDTDGGTGAYDLGDVTDTFRDYDKYFDPNASKGLPFEKLLVKTSNGKEKFISIFNPLYDSNGGTAAVICVTRDELEVGTVISQFLIAIVLSAALVSSVIMWIVYNLIKKNFIRPIGILTKSAEAMVGNLEREEEINIDVHTNDEFETLAEAFTKMDVDLRDYIKELSAVTSERERHPGIPVHGRYKNTDKIWSEAGNESGGGIKRH